MLLSLLELLIIFLHAGWVNTLAAENIDGAKGFMFFVCVMDITEKGLGTNIINEHAHRKEFFSHSKHCHLLFFVEHVDDIISSVFQYIKMLQELGPQDWMFKEFQVCFFGLLRSSSLQSFLMYTSS